MLKAIEGVEVFAGSRLPAWMRLSHPTRTGDWVVTTQPPYALSRPAGFEGTMMAVMSTFGWRFGNHGYRPDRRDMGGVFFALGRGVSDDLRVPEVHQVDVAATVAMLLGIHPPRDSEGRSVPGIGVHLLTDKAADSELN